MSWTVTARRLSAFSDSIRGTDPVQPIEPLTNREEVLLTGAAGRTNAEIAMWAYETGRIRR